MPPIQIDNSNALLTNYNGTKIPILGKIQVSCKIREKISDIEIFVAVCENTSSILDLKTIENLQLLYRVLIIKSPDDIDNLNSNNIEKLIRENKNIFEGIGNIDYVYDLKLKPDYEGKIGHCRRVPFKILGDFKNVLNKMESNKIIEKIEKPTEFVNAFTLVRKENKDLVFVLDPQHLNTCLLREHFSLPTFEEISAKINNAKVFTILDASRAFWQIKLSKESSKFTTFQTPFGRYKFLRMTYRIKTGLVVFHRVYKEYLKIFQI